MHRHTIVNAKHVETNIFFIGSSEQCSRRAIVLSPASALALAFALASASINVKVLC